MKILSSSSLLRVTLGVAIATALVLLSYPFANIFFGKSLNTPWYFVILLSLSGATIVLGWFYILGQAAESRQDSDEIQAIFKSLAELDNVFAPRVKSQHQDSPLKVTMDVNGTPVTIESTDAGKVEDFVKHITRSIQAENLAKAKVSELLIRESAEPYKTENNPE